MKEMLEKYNAINAMFLIGKQVKPEDFAELKNLAIEVNKISTTIQFDVDGSDIDLLNSIKQYIRDSLERE